MAESYKKVFPGNAVNHLNAYGQPGADFTAAGRPTGSPLDRRQQALMFCPGWLAVRKVGYAKITEAATAAFDIIVPSPDTRSDDKPRADIVGLHIPQTALCYRAGFRVLPTSDQPGYYSQGARQATTTSGILGTNTNKIVLASAVPAASAAASIGATAITTATDAGSLIVASGEVPIGSRTVQTAFGSPVAITQSGGLTLKLHVTNTAVNATGTVTTLFSGGVYVMAELCYLIPEEVAGINEVPLPGSNYSGFIG